MNLPYRYRGLSLVGLLALLLPWAAWHFALSDTFGAWRECGRLERRLDALAPTTPATGATVPAAVEAPELILSGGLLDSVRRFAPAGVRATGYVPVTTLRQDGIEIHTAQLTLTGPFTELLRDLLLFWSAKEQKMVTLQEYVDKMPAEQKYIYFAAGDSSDRLAKLPSTELVLGKGYDVLLLTEDVDEFCLQILRTYPRKDAEGKDGTVEFKNVNSGDLGLESEEEKKAAEDATAENKDLFDAMKTALDGKVKEVKVSTRLKDHPVCLSADGPLSIEMEKVLSKQPGSEGVKSDKVLELNANHPVFAVLKAAQEAGDTDKINKYSTLLYAQAQLIEGLPVDDPTAYAEAVCSLMK